MTDKVGDLRSALRRLESMPGDAGRDNGNRRRL